MITRCDRTEERQQRSVVGVTARPICLSHMYRLVVGGAVIPTVWRNQSVAIG
jgi:hypothetical protein